MGIKQKIFREKMKITSLIAGFVGPDYCNDCQVFVETNLVHNNIIGYWSQKAEMMCTLLPYSFQSMCKEVVHTAFDAFTGMVFDGHEDYCKVWQLCDDDSSDDVEAGDQCRACANMVADIQFMTQSDKDKWNVISNSIEEAYCSKQPDDEESQANCHKYFGMVEKLAVEFLNEHTAKSICAAGRMCNSALDSNQL